MTPTPRSAAARPAPRAPTLFVAALRSASLVGLALALGACKMGCASAPGGGVSTAGPFDETSGGEGAGGEGAGGEGADSERQRETLRAAVDRQFSPVRTLGYGPARDTLYAWEDRRGGVCGLYSGWCARLGPGDPSIAADAVGFNAEHVWPQSMGARAEPLRSDLHHLFPARQNVNSSRSNLPFGEVDDAAAEAWYRADASQSRTPREHVGEWSERGGGLWEPRENRKGDVARAVFYVAAVYPEAVDPSFFPPMRQILLAWNRLDPPDGAERERSAWVAGLQGTENPFVRDPALADRIWGDGPLPARAPAEPDPTDSAPVGDTEPGGPRAGTPPARAPAGPPTGPRAALSVSEIHYDNAGADIGEGVEIAGPDGARLDGWALRLVSGGAVYRTLPLSGTLGGGARWIAVEGLQNGPADGLALVDPAGRVVEALAWEGAFTGADGTAFRDLGVAEGSGTPRGTSLQRVGGRWRAGRPASPGRPNR